MKKTIVSILLVLLALSTFAQRPERISREQLESARIAFITTRLNLTPDQAQIFWPVYNQFNDERSEKLRQIASLSDNQNELSEEEAKRRIQKRFDIQKAMISDEMAFVERAAEILSYKQILVLNQINKDFTRQLFQRQRRGRD
ncbi:hypothetical protein [Algoriphagus namhaensis]